MRACAGRPARRADASLPAAMSLLLQSAGADARRARIDHGAVAGGHASGRCVRRSAIALVRRRTVCASGSGRDPGCRSESGSLHQPDHLGCHADARKAGRPRQSRARPRPAFHSRCRSCQRREDLRLQGRHSQEARGGQVGEGTRPAAHAQCRRASPQHRQPAGHDRLRGRNGSRASGSRPHAVLCLGAAQPLVAHADPGILHDRGQAGGGGARRRRTARPSFPRASSSSIPSATWTKRASG